MIPPTPRIRPVPLPDVSSPHSSRSSEHENSCYDTAPIPIVITGVSGLPSPTTPGIHLHEILRPSSPQCIYYDLGSPPTTVIFYDKQFTPFTLTRLATSPPLTYLRIMLPTTPPLPVMVYNLRGVTIFDVLNAVYHSLHAPARSSVWEELDYLDLVTPPSTPLRPHSFDAPRPHQPSGDSSAPEARRKIDHLRGRTSFVGLVPGPGGPESWCLYTAD